MNDCGRNILGVDGAGLSSGNAGAAVVGWDDSGEVVRVFNAGSLGGCDRQRGGGVLYRGTDIDGN